MDAVNKKAEVARLFSEVSKTLKHCMRKTFEDIGITMPQGILIGTLIKCGEMKITELSNKINLSNSTISGIVDRLEKQQLVERTRSEEDKRIVYVKVTPKLEKLFKGVHKKADESFEDLLSAGTPEEIEKIIEGLDALKRILNHSKE
jgi:MarR family transcriptional regulator, organic hydroperoxide resistance regulator